MASDRHPLEAYADSYAKMARQGDGRVDCLSVEVDIRQNMIRATSKELATLRARVEELERERDYWKVEAEGERAKVARRDAQLSRLQSLLDEARTALEEFGNPRNWVVNGRFDPHSGNFVATTFARAALSRITEMGESNG